MAENSGRYYLEMEWPKGDKKSEKKKKKERKKERKKAKKRSNTPRANVKKRWEIKRKALLISESIARKTETRYDGCLNIKKKKKSYRVILPKRPTQN